ncbi:MAG: PRC-barrel domain-containing protein [Chloroflexi bacterium]|nr:PRC-barrel domain-containing protein [Chloroflexota bacterium]MBV9600609.1 PRC-barrel domain-containing protein [Chloroflexota bacterium]
MNIRIGARVEATDGSAGEVSRIVVSARGRRLTEIVVRDSKLFGTERLVPMENVIQATSDKVSLKLSHAQFNLLPPFNRTVEYTPDAPDTFMGQVARHPFAVDQSDVNEDEAAFKGGEKVEATDGTVGTVDEVILDPSTNALTHIVLREGHLWQKRLVTIPIDNVDYAARNVVYLKVDKQHLETLATPADA